ncbi:MAG: DUF3429 domain-containing protein [Salaquimonas sp.]|jgi:hypothetical protein|nr:DUF3429 domain-containing protein [Salaquimonas sp.]
MTSSGQSGDSTSAARRIGDAGSAVSLIPFVTFAVVLLIAGGHSVWSDVLVDGFKTWSVLSLSFVAGIRWGVFLRTGPAGTLTFVFATIPVVIGWAALFVTDITGIGVLLLVHCAAGAWDSFSARRGEAPDWYAGMRIVWTLVVAVTHIAVFAAIY